MMVYGYSIYSLFMMVAVISFLGFCLEDTWLSLTKGYIDNRNMNLPFLLGYGLLVVGIYIIIGIPERIVFLGKPIFPKSKFRRYLLYFMCMMVIVSLGEILLGTFVEKMFGFEYWNYTRIPMHITKYTSVPTSTGFSLIITFFMDKCFEPIMRLIERISFCDVRRLSVLLMTLMVTDFFVCFRKMYRTRRLNVKYRKYIGERNHQLN